MLIYAIRPIRSLERGYEVYDVRSCSTLGDGSRLADGTAIAHCATYGEASRYLNTLEAEDAVIDWIIAQAEAPAAGL